MVIVSGGTILFDVAVTDIISAAKMDKTADRRHGDLCTALSVMDDCLLPAMDHG